MEHHLATWSGACTGTGACQVTMDGARDVTADYDRNQYTTNVTRDGTGTGTVSGVGIDCGNDCTETQDYGSTNTLTATPDADSSFSAWTGCDSPAGNTCVVTVDGAEQVGATFVKKSTILSYIPAIMGSNQANTFQKGYSKKEQ